MLKIHHCTPVLCRGGDWFMMLMSMAEIVFRKILEYCFKNKKHKLTEKNFLVSSARKFDLN